MGTNFRRNDFWNRLGGQTLVMIGRWYSRQQLANHTNAFPPKRFQKIAAPKSRTHSPSSFWSGELGSVLTRQFLILLVNIAHGLKC